MATNQDYRLLLVTSLPESFDTITELARRYFANVEPLYWEMGNKQTIHGYKNYLIHFQERVGITILQCRLLQLAT